MTIRLLPDLAAMAVLLTVLYYLRRRHPQERVGLWIVGLIFIFVEAIAHTLYAPSGPWHIPTHIVALDAYLAAGIIFLWAAAMSLYPRRPTLVYLCFNTPPFAVLLTLYGLDVRIPFPYLAVIVSGTVIAIFSTSLAARMLNVSRAFWLIVPQLLIWGSAWISVAARHYRDAVYLPLFVLFLATAVMFQLSLPRRSLGKFCIVAGF